MNVAVVGSRSFSDTDLLYDTLNPLGPFTLVSGGARGADRMGEDYADQYNLPKIIHYADWDTHGRSAGYLRNKLIVRDADLVIAFWDGSSRGTKLTIDLAHDANVPVRIIRT